jgi:hypothetical protein
MNFNPAKIELFPVVERTNPQLQKRKITQQYRNLHTSNIEARTKFLWSVRQESGAVTWGGSFLLKRPAVPGECNQIFFSFMNNEEHSQMQPCAEKVEARADNCHSGNNCSYGAHCLDSETTFRHYAIYMYHTKYVTKTYKYLLWFFQKPLILQSGILSSVSDSQAVVF